MTRWGFALCLLVACTHQRPLRSLVRENGKTVTVELRNGSTAEVRVGVDRGHATLTQLPSGRPIELADVRSASVEDAGRASSVGLGVGMVGGIVAGGTYGYLSGDDPDGGLGVSIGPFHGSAMEKAIEGAVLFGVVGAAFGAVAGRNMGGTTIYAGERSGGVAFKF